MKWIGLKYTLFFLLLLFIVACSPVRYVSIETYNPSEITFPKGVNEILIVNNAVSQTDVPFESTLHKIPDSVKVSADSTTFDFCQVLGEKMAESASFEDVRLLEGCYRTDQKFLSDQNLTKDEVNLFCEEHGVDAVVSLDRLLFRMKEYAEKVYDFDVAGLVDVEAAAVVRIYLPDREKPLATIYLTDTLTPRLSQDGDENVIWSMLLASDRTVILREVARYLASASDTHFIPYWREDVRWYYTSSNARWKEASAYAASEKWSKASFIWKNLYEETTSWKAKARLASNLALCFELEGDLKQAFSWATISYQFLLDHLGDDKRTVKLQKLYLGVLEHRIVNEKKLFLQIDKK